MYSDPFYHLPGKDGKTAPSTLDSYSFTKTYIWKPKLDSQPAQNNHQSTFGLQNTQNQTQNDQSLKLLFKQRNTTPESRNGETQNTSSALSNLLGGSQTPTRSPLKLTLKKKQITLLDLLKKKDFKKKSSFETSNQTQQAPEQHDQQPKSVDPTISDEIRQQQHQIMAEIEKRRQLEKQKVYITKEEKKRRLIEELKKQKNQKKEKEMTEEERARLVQQMVKNEKEAKLLWKKKMEQERELRLKALADEGNHVEFTLLGRYHQTNEKQAHNVNPLINHLVSYDYGAEIQESPAYRVPNDFKDYHEYRSVFEPLMVNEYIHTIKGAIQQASKASNASKSLACKFRVHTLGKGEEITYIELKEKKDNNSEFVTSGSKDIFSLNFAKNYMILISKTREIDMKKINNFMNPNEFYFVGFLNTSDQKATDVPKAMIKVNPTKFQLKFKEDWHDCFIFPLDKITTMIREFFALKRLEFSDVCNSVLKPQAVANIHSSDNYELFERFFRTIKSQYNQSQFESIKQICLSTEGINLLQGPPGTGKTHTLVGIVSGLAHYLKNSKTSARKHIMICTPSNTAIDEIIMRLCTSGLYDEYGKRYKPNLVRIGILDRNPPEIVRQHSIEYLTQQEINKMKDFDKDANEKTIHQIEEELVRLSQRIEKLKRQPDGDRKELDALFDKRRALYTKFQDHQMMRNLEKEKYNETAQRILMGCDIICCTLGSAGSDKLEGFRNYLEAVIVDESAQCVEISNIIPLQYSPRKFILIGDPKQLPATTFSPDANQTLFNRSMFERILHTGITPYFLNEQYRMLPNIRKFPSLTFYDDRLIDAKSVMTREFPNYLGKIKNQNVLFIDMKFSKEKLEDMSYINQEEAKLAMKIMSLFINSIQSANLNIKESLGIISPYKKQVQHIDNLFRTTSNISDYKKYLEVNTVDSFQGKEKDLILFSTVRANANINSNKDRANLIGFLNDLRRMNVAITRPRFSLIIIGNSDTLCSHETWRNLIEFYHKNDYYINIPTAAHIERAFEIIFRNKGTVPPEWKRFENKMQYGSAFKSDKKRLMQEYDLPNFSDKTKSLQTKRSQEFKIKKSTETREKPKQQIPEKSRPSEPMEFINPSTPQKKTYSQYEAALSREIAQEFNPPGSGSAKKVKKPEEPENSILIPSPKSTPQNDKKKDSAVRSAGTPSGKVTITKTVEAGASLMSLISKPTASNKKSADSIIDDILFG